MNFSELVAPNGLFSDGDWIEKKDQDENGTVRLIQLADIGACFFKDKSAKFVTEAKAKELNCTYLQKGDILIARLPDPLGRACIFPLDGKYITAVDVAIVRISRSDINPKYVMYMINSPGFRNDIKHYESGTTRKRISRKNLDNIQFNIPPLPEQEHIISRIEELFSQLDASVAELKTAKERLKVYRQAVLNSCLGDGTLRSIGECIKSMGQGWSPKCERISIEDDDSWAVITTTAIQPMNFSFKENKKLPDSLEPRVKHELKVGDLLITRAGPRSRCGVCCMVKQTKKRLLNCDKVYCLKVNDLIVLPEYMETVLNAPNFQREIAFCKTGGNDSGVNLTQSRFLSIEVPTPSLDIQKMILAKIDANLSVCDSIEKTVDTALQQAEALRQSILKKAFEGGL